MLTQLIYFARSLTPCSLAPTCQDAVKAHIGAPLFPDAARSLLMKKKEEGVGEGVFANDDADEMPPYTYVIFVCIQIMSGNHPDSIRHELH